MTVAELINRLAQLQKDADAECPGLNVANLPVVLLTEADGMFLLEENPAVDVVTPSDRDTPVLAIAWQSIMTAPGHDPKPKLRLVPR